MNLLLFIAKRYLFSKKKVQAIHFISGVSMLGVFIGSAALIVILSVFNGFEHLVLALYNNFTSELRISPTVGKTFDPNFSCFFELKKDRRILNYTEVLQDKVLLRYEDAQCIALVRGVSDQYFNGKKLDGFLLDGSLKLKNDKRNLALISSTVQGYLSVNIQNDFQDIEVYSPKKGIPNSTDPRSEFSIGAIHPVGVFQSQQYLDHLMLVPLNFARDLLNEPRKISAIEINLRADVCIDDFQKEVVFHLGKHFFVKNRNQQNQLLYKILNSEKLAVFLILTFVLIIAIFNIIGSLTMLIIDKRKDIAILSSLGASHTFIRKIFFMEGMMISMIGCFLGIFVAFIFCSLQRRYSFISMGGSGSFSDAYPIVLKWTDFGLVFLTVMSISIMVSFLSSRLNIKHIDDISDDL